MGIDICLTAKLPRNAPPEEVLSRAKAWIDQAARFVLVAPTTMLPTDDGSMIAASLFPQAQDVFVTASAGRLGLEARTNFPGPGYHDYVCTLAKGLAAHLGVVWEADDDTEYFDTGDWSALRGSMLSWLRRLAEVLLGDTENASGIALCMDMRHGFKVDAAVATPTGPRSRAWIEQVAADPMSGTDFFAWWDKGLTARTLRDRAVVRMWCDVHWTRPLTPESTGVLKDVNSCLEQANALDSELDLPWPEWRETLGQIESGIGERPASRAIVDANVRSGAMPRIGYRRAPVVHRLPGWELTLPGSLELQYGDEWVAFDETRSVRLTLMRASEDSAEERDPEEMIREQNPRAKLKIWTNGQAKFAAHLEKIVEEADSYYSLFVIGSSGPCLCLATITFVEDSDREWAMGVAQTIKRYSDPS
ncbi:MAG: hypothetical protein ACK5XO_11045 [Phycisphaerales bacterium]